MTPEKLEKLPKPIERTMSRLELAVMAEVVDRIRQAGEITPVVDHLLNRMYALGTGKTKLKALIREAISDADKTVDQIYQTAVSTDYIRNKALYESVGKEYLPYEDNEWLQQLVEASRRQTKDDLRAFENLTKTTGFNVTVGGRRVFSPLSEYFEQSLDKSLFSIASGMQTYSQAVGSVIDEMTRSGLRVIEYASGKTDRIEVAARRAVMTGVAQMTDKVNEKNAEELRTDYWEVDWHAGARNKGIGIINHQSWQGKVYSSAEMVSVCGMGDILGFAGVNCYHVRFPFISGVSKRKYTDEWLAEQNKKENTPREYMGKEYTLYDALQHQRKLERTIRKQKQDVKLLERARADEEDIIAAKCRLRLTNQNYVDFSKAMGIRQQLERLRTVKEQSDVSAKQSRFPVGTAQRTTHYRDSTDEWKEVSPEQAKNVTDLKEYEIGGRKYVVDGRNVVLDYKPYERKIAEIIAKKYGKSVQMIPRIINPKGKKTADFLIDGILYDLKTPEGNGKNTIDGILKTGKGQAERFILSLDKTPMDMSEIMRQLVNTFKTDHLKFMKEVVIYKNDNILNVFQRKI